MAVESPYLFQNTLEDMIPYNVTGTEGFVPVFKNEAVVKTESGLTYGNCYPTRKRVRDSGNMMMAWNGGGIQNGNRCGGGGMFTFLSDDVSLLVQQQQLEMDRLIAQHMEKVRMEIEERRKRHCRRIVVAIEQRIANNLRAKEDEIEKIRKLNWALEEKVQSLSVEGQFWRDLAHSNEAQVQSLQANLDQVLASQALNDCQQGGNMAVIEHEAESCCGSSGESVARGAERLCKHCGEGESRVLLLPCRHLCLCAVCATTMYTCPVCHTPKNASVHVNVSGYPVN